ncbi:MAG: hypothetical protein ACOX19_05530 [Fermentimonas sp.]|jgi:hypothetical protein
MKPKGNILNEKNLEPAQVENAAGLYNAPQVEVIDIELPLNLLASTNLSDIEDGGEAW